MCSCTGDSGGGRRPNRLGLIGHIKMFFVWIYGLFACFSTLLSVQRETEVSEAEQPRNRFVHSSFQLTQLRFTLFIYILDANNKGFIGLYLLIIQLIKSAIRTISRPPETISTQDCMWGGRPSRGHLFLCSCNLIGSQMNDLRFFIIFG